MNAFYPFRESGASPSPAANLLRRAPVRATATMSWQLHQRLQRRADEEGRSLSNLIAHLLEVATSAS